ncbi:MAG TPA: NUDIX domain-containing protein [Planctomycetaceae bacterium]|nr:NUDIX domain-containing protein [Planctomycetaceae bacterium]
MKEVVVVIPHFADRVLMQLRDDKLEIDFPAHWGFFGGSLEVGETAQQAAVRELKEETSYSPTALHYLKTDRLSSLDNLVSHAFYCSLSKPLERLSLNEGMDWGLFCLDEIESEYLYSGKCSSLFPVISHSYIADIVSHIFDDLSDKSSTASSMN